METNTNLYLLELYVFLSLFYVDVYTIWNHKNVPDSVINSKEESLN